MRKNCAKNANRAQRPASLPRRTCPRPRGEPRSWRMRWRLSALRMGMPRTVWRAADLPRSGHCPVGKRSAERRVGKRSAPTETPRARRQRPSRNHGGCAGAYPPYAWGYPAWARFIDLGPLDDRCFRHCCRLWGFHTAAQAGRMFRMRAPPTDHTGHSRRLPRSAPAPDRRGAARCPPVPDRYRRDRRSRARRRGTGRWLLRR